MKLPTLYILTEKDQIQEWTIAVRNNTYFTCEGITNGKITQSSPTVCKGKNTGKANGTSDAEQAQKEAEAKWKKKKEKGYCESIEQAKKGISAFFEPMLAHSYDDYKEELWDNVLIYSQPKLDGCLAFDTQVTTDIGTVTIEELFNNKASAKLIKSYNTLTNQVEFKPIVGVYKNGNDVNEIKSTQWFRLTLEDGKQLTLTGNHRIWIKNLNCWRRVDELVGDEEVTLE